LTDFTKIWQKALLEVYAWQKGVWSGYGVCGSFGATLPEKIQRKSQLLLPNFYLPKLFFLFGQYVNLRWCKTLLRLLWCAIQYRWLPSNGTVNFYPAFY